MDSVAVATAASDDSQPLTYGNWGCSNFSVERGLVKLCKSFQIGKEDLAIVYQAGPTGFVLAGRLIRFLAVYCGSIEPALEAFPKAGTRGFHSRKSL